MFDKLFKTNSFDKLFPELMPYIKTDEERELLTSDKEFIEKYQRNINIISTFLYEVSKYHKSMEVKKIIKKYIISLDDIKLVDVILLYLNLSDEDKQEKEFFILYDKKYGLEDKTEEQLNKEHDIDRRYNNIKTGKETFHDLTLDSLYNTCDYPERELINSILSQRGGWDAFKFMFEDRYHANFKQLLKLLNKALVDGDIINEEVKVTLGERYFEELIFTLISNHNLEIAKHVKTLIKNRRYDLIVNMIRENLLGDVVFINTINQEELNDKELISRLENLRVKRPTNN
jgi:hypothetical protein